MQLGEETDYQSAVRAEDASDGDISEKVQVDAEQVNLEKEGTYTVLYTVADQAGNTAEARGLVIIQPVEATKITLDQSEISLRGNQYANLQAVITPKNWAGKVEWSSNDPAVATVSDGLVAWAGKGSCVITASADGQTAVCKVTCSGVAATSVRLDRYAVKLKEGDITILTAEPVPSNWKGDIVWKSSNEQVATVEKGVVTAIGLGSCTITASAGDAKVSCEITCRSMGLMDDVSGMWHSFVDQ